MRYREVQRGDIIVFLKPGEPDLFLVKRAIAIPGDRIHLEHGIVYLNGVAQNEPQAGKPADDGNPYHAYNAYRDDFPCGAAGPNDEVTASWALDLPTHLAEWRPCSAAGQGLCDGRQPDRVAGRAVLGLCAAGEYRGQAHVCVLVFPDACRSDQKTSMADRVGFMGHVLIHVFDQTRWSRTLHIVR